MLHFFDSDGDPRHFFPPPDGGGLVQVRVLVWIPVPHVLVQTEYLPHLLHLPSTENQEKIYPYILPL